MQLFLHAVISVVLTGLMAIGCGKRPVESENDKGLIVTNEYGDIVTGDFSSAAGSNSLQVWPPYPNPTFAVLAVEWRSPPATDLRVCLYNSENYNLLFETLRNTGGYGNHHLAVDVRDNILPGEYALSVENSIGSFRYQVVVQPPRYIPAGIKVEINENYSIDKFLSWYDYILRADTFVVFLHARYVGMADYFIRAYNQKQDVFYEMALACNQVVQGWKDASPDMDSNYIKCQWWGTGFDAHFRGLALDGLVMSNSVVVDTLWMYYDENRLPKYAGYSEKQESLLKKINE